MKKYYLTTLIFAMAQVAFAQRVLCPKDYGSLKSKRGLWASEIMIGPKLWKGLVGSVGGIFYFQGSKNFAGGQYRFPKQFIKVNINYSRDKLNNLNHEALAGELAFGYTPVSFFDHIYPSIIVGGFLSYDRPFGNEIDADAASRLTQIKPGGYYGVEVLAFLNNPHWAVVLHVDQRYLAGNFWGDRRLHFGIGVRYHFTEVRKLSNLRGR